jgi:beta-lactamase regulating signal transducer with metallopeptidase domain
MIDHLWQSTLFAALIALVVPLFRKQSAALRFWLWFAASAKFLFPLSLLVWLGGFLPVLPAPAPLLAAKSVVIAPVLIVPPDQIMPVAQYFWAIWAGGALFLAVRWLARWRAMNAALRDASDLALGTPVPVKQVASFLSPALVGIWRPVILMPRGIVEHLSPSELRAVLAHELSHFHRRDNLLALAQMLTQLLFWFHPLVWWIGRRLVAEREQACDERVLETGNAPAAYADGILKICRFHLQPPLACTAGVSGGSLQARVHSILSHRDTMASDGSRILLLSLLAVATILLPLLAGAPVNRLAREVASVLQAPRLPALPKIMEGPLAPPPLPHLPRPRAVVAVPPALIVAAAPVAESIAPPSVAQSAVPQQQVVIASEAPSQSDDQLVCRRLPRSSETRLSGPSVCMTASAWAEMRMRGMDIAPDGRTVVATGSFERSRSLHPPSCVGGVGCVASVSPVDPQPIRK